MKNTRALGASPLDPHWTLLGALHRAPGPHAARLERVALFDFLFLINGAPNHPLPTGTLKQSYATGLETAQPISCLFQKVCNLYLGNYKNMAKNFKTKNQLLSPSGHPLRNYVLKLNMLAITEWSPFQVSSFEYNALHMNVLIWSKCTYFLTFMEILILVLLDK